MQGNCYSATEAVYIILGGKESQYDVYRIPKMYNGGITHWFLRHRHTGDILDVSRLQFKDKLPDYEHAVKSSFYPQVSNLAKDIIKILTYKLNFNIDDRQYE